ncbi:hypothetical protein ACH5RR_016941 [Cinchona calisaya]|uniref:PGG domain-containing protein n=1 Tax=Cinchona calisaya TaxID=153742 RepID=A0ABD3A037_9GENT
MSLHFDYITPYTKLLRAAKENNVRELYDLYAQEPYLLHGYSWLWEENPLHVACKYGNLHFVKQVIKISPELASKRSQNGFSPMHVAAANGHFEIVQALAEFDYRLCLEEDLNSNIPLHIAAMEGKDDVARALVFAYPESLQKVTHRGETALHLALKNGHCVTFRVLMEEVKRFNLKELLNRKDYEGNTILHIAASQKLLEILELLLSRESANAIKMDINSVNRRGYTTLDVHYETSNDTVAKKIRSILVEYGAKEGQFLQNNIGHGQKPQTILSESNLSLMVFVMIATLTFGAACSPPKFFENEIPDKKAPHYLLDMLFHRGSGHVTAAFYFMVFNVAGFMASMVAILLLTWPLFFGNMMILASAAVGIVFMILVEKSMPHFTITVGTFQISVAVCVWFSALVFIGCGVLIVVSACRFLAMFKVARRMKGFIQILGN